MTAQIQSLIDKQDNFEIVRDTIAQILADESASQVALAIADGKPDPDQWKLRVCIERANPWEAFQNEDASAEIDDSPIVNVWFDSSGYDESKSNVVERQYGAGVFNIDIYGYGVSVDDPAGGHTPGDKSASLKCQQGIRLVRNILMSSYYTRLGFPVTNKDIGQRFVRNITAFQPEQGNQHVQNVAAARVAFTVKFNERSPQYEGEILEEIGIDIKRDPDGFVLAQAEYSY